MGRPRPKSPGLLLLAAAVALATGSAASAGPTLGANVITITADRVSPRSLVNKAGSFRFFPVWTNLDAVAHTVTFDDGRCILTIAAGERKWCGPGFTTYAGTYRYRVSHLVDPVGEIVVVPNERRVTMEALRTTVRAGQAVVLQGTVFAGAISGPFFGMNMPQTITILRRVAGSRKFVVVWRVRSQSRATPGVPCYDCDPNENVWSTTVRPRVTTTYVARIVDPPDRTVWLRAESRRIVVRVAPQS